MTTQYRTQGLVFKQEDGLESDRSFSIFTHDFGRLEVSGKAIRKTTSKLKGNIEVFSFSEVEFIQGKNKKTLTDTLFLKRYNNISKSPEKLAVAYNIANILDVFLKGQQKDENIWSLLVDVFEKLDNDSLQNRHYRLLYYYFVGNFTSILGYGLELSKCAVCSQKLSPDALYFSNKEGGVVCAACAGSHESSVKITSDVVKILRLILKKDWQTLLRLKVPAATWPPLNVLDDYARYLMATHSFKT